jgi:hypothetical protein
VYAVIDFPFYRRWQGIWAARKSETRPQWRIWCGYSIHRPDPFDQRRVPRLPGRLPNVQHPKAPQFQGSQSSGPRRFPWAVGEHPAQLSRSLAGNSYVPPPDCRGDGADPSSSEPQDESVVRRRSATDVCAVRDLSQFLDPLAW